MFVFSGFDNVAFPIGGNSFAACRAFLGDDGQDSVDFFGIAYLEIDGLDSIGYCVSYILDFQVGEFMAVIPFVEERSYVFTELLFESLLESIEADFTELGFVIEFLYIMR